MNLKSLSFSYAESPGLLFRRLFYFSFRKAALAVALFFVSVLAHNLISGLLRIEEPVFFLIAVIGVPVYLLVSIAYTLSVRFGGRR